MTESVTVEGEIDAVTPAGAPEAVSETVCGPPETVNVEVRMPPTEPVPEDGELDRETVARKLAETEEGVLTATDVGLAVPVSAPPHALNA